MFGPVGGPELILIVVLALLLFGPRKLPQIGKSVGKALAEFRGVTNEFRSTLEREVEIDELRKTQSEINDVGREVDKAVREVTSGVARGADVVSRDEPSPPAPAPASDSVPDKAPATPADGTRPEDR